MPNLKDLKNRIRSVKATQKITQAMKMVAASKLRRARHQAETALPFAKAMEKVLRSLAANVADSPMAPPLLIGNGRDEIYLLIVITADRGLCGSFNASIVKAAREKINRLLSEGKQVKLYCIGRKGYELLKRSWRDKIVKSISHIGKGSLSYTDAESVAVEIRQMFESEVFDRCAIIYSQFKTAMSQEVMLQQLIPLELETQEEEKHHGAHAIYEYEPSEKAILEDLLPRNLGVQIYHALLESVASEHGARMTAMDNATRNAGEMIQGLTLQYNRTRQAVITKELIEIISGAEAI